MTSSTDRPAPRQGINFAAFFWPLLLAYTTLVAGVSAMLLGSLPRWVAINVTAAGFGILFGTLAIAAAAHRRGRKEYQHRIDLYTADAVESERDYDAAVRKLVQEIGELPGGLPRSQLNMWAYSELSPLLDPGHFASRTEMRNVVAVALIRSVPPKDRDLAGLPWTFELLLEEKVPVCDHPPPQVVADLLIGTGQQIRAHFPATAGSPGHGRR